MSRKAGSNGYRIDNLEKTTTNLQKEMASSADKFNNHIKMHVCDDLQQVRFPGSDKPLYTYYEIADRYSISKSKVQSIAEEENLTRRNKKLV